MSGTIAAIFIAIEKGSNSPGWGKGGEFYARRLFFFKGMVLKTIVVPVVSTVGAGHPHDSRQDAGATVIRG